MSSIHFFQEDFRSAFGRSEKTEVKEFRLGSPMGRRSNLLIRIATSQQLANGFLRHDNNLKLSGISLYRNHLSQGKVFGRQNKGATKTVNERRS